MKNEKEALSATAGLTSSGEHTIWLWLRPHFTVNESLISMNPATITN